MKVWKVFLGIGLTVLIIGIALLITGLALNGWAFDIDYEMNTFTQEEDATALDLNLSSGEMNVQFYPGDKVEITYPTAYNAGYTVTEDNGTITVKPKEGLRIHWVWWWNKTPAVTVRIPTSSAMDLKLGLSAGKVTVADGTFNDVDINLSAGKLNLGNLKCNKFKSHLSAGSLETKALECTTLDLKLSAGSADLDKITCGYINVKLSAGSANLTVVGSLHDYFTSVKKSAGSCNLPEYPVPPGSVGDFKHIDVSLSAGSVNFQFTD
ncbi:MAG: DUF4097 domain-containing protein [Clostridia bacterium]|nr:DUF4097 domain-containing protein [Clostridia bacterium]